MIQSHYKPYKTLEQHIDEVSQAANSIISKHSYGNHNIDELLNYIIQFHDLGKALPEFQKYIENPDMYQGRKIDKAHSPTSLLLWTAYAQEKKIDLEKFLLVAIIVWKHHGDFPTFDDFLFSLSMYDFEELVYPFDKIKLKINSDFIPDDIDIQKSFNDDFFSKYELKKAVELRLKAQLLFSILIEADRTFLALSKEIIQQKFLNKQNAIISQNIVPEFLKTKSKLSNQNSFLNEQRNKIRKEIIQNSLNKSNIESITLPTGLGKTMIAAEWALKHREHKHRKIIIILPFLSIIDQTVKEYNDLLSNYDSENLILEAHSIAERKYVDDSNEEVNSKANDSIDFLADTWDNDFIITTFDQFLYSLLSSKNNNILRFHNLTDALIIIDEIQALPTNLWQPLALALNSITEKFNSKVLIMSATQPDFLQTKELVPEPSTIFSTQNRYKIILKYKNSIKISNFIDECINRLENENWNSKRVLIILNTRASARAILDALEDLVKADIFFLSADVTPKERLDNIEKIKNNNSCLVIATQCIEAGVDIDMDFVIRDIAPFDSIVQCAGRCNRNGLKQQGIIEVISLKNENGKIFSNFVYDSILLEKTKLLLSEYNDIEEKQIFIIVKKYFSLLKKSKDIGQLNVENWAYWKQVLDVKKLLRGDNKKYDFIINSQDNNLKDDLSIALQENDRWKKKRQIKALRGRIAKVTVSIWENKNIIPEEIATQIGTYFFLNDNYYIDGKGIDLSYSKSNVKIL